MSSTAKIAVGAVLVALAGAAGYAALSKSPAAAPEAPAAPAPDGAVPAAEEPSAFSGSVRDLALRTGSYRCIVSSTGADADSKFDGVVLASNGKVRSEFTVPVNGTMADSYAIIDGEWMYTWSSAMPQGMKMRIPQTAPEPGAATAQTQGDIDQDYSWECDEWQADASAFTPPADISFMEFSVPAFPTGIPQGMPQ